MSHGVDSARAILSMRPTLSGDASIPFAMLVVDRPGAYRFDVYSPSRWAETPMRDRPLDAASTGDGGYVALVPISEHAALNPRGRPIPGSSARRTPPRGPSA